jgi:hypothetical protein
MGFGEWKYGRFTLKIMHSTYYNGKHCPYLDMLHIEIWDFLQVLY